MLPILKDGIIYPLPKVVYRMFDYTDVPEVSSCTVDRYWNVCSFILQRKKCCCRRGCILQGNCNFILTWIKYILKNMCVICQMGGLYRQKTVTSLWSQFFTNWLTLRWQITYLFFPAVNWFTSGLFTCHWIGLHAELFIPCLNCFLPSICKDVSTRLFLAQHE